MTISPLAQACAVAPNRAAVIDDACSISYRTLFSKVQAVALQLSQAGMLPKSKLACIGSNSLEMLMLYWACIEADVIFFPISPKLPQGQIQDHCTRLAVSHFCCLDGCFELTQIHRLSIDFTLEATQPPRQINSEDAVNLMLTSGSGGTPKAAAHSLKNHIASAVGAVSTIPLKQGDHWLLSLPIFHIGGLAILNRCALAGATVVMRDSNLPLAEQLRRDNISHLSLVEAQLLELLEQPGCLASVHSLLLGGGAISASTLEKLRVSNIQTFTSYGMTEMSSQITTGAANPDGSCGKALPNRALRLQDGIIQVAGDCLFLGYANTDRTDSNWTLPLTADGWFNTQDRGEHTQEGNLVVLGRADNMFICGGENIQPEEIETALKQLHHVDDAIVFPISDARFSKLPAAIIKYSKSQSPLEQEFLDQHLEQHIARFKRPRQYYLWPEKIEFTGLKVQRSKVIDWVKEHYELN